MNYGRLLIDLEGVSLTNEERELLRHPSVSGVILFTRNYDSPAQLAHLTQQIHRVRPSLIVATDHEGGRVQRFVKHFTALPAMRTYGVEFDRDPDRAMGRLAQATQTMISELYAVHVNVSFAPVLDLDYGVSEIIGERSLHRDPTSVAALAQPILQTMRKNHMPTMGKHFPGHGGVAADSHTELPIDLRSHAEIFAQDILPYRRLINQLDAIMPAFVQYPACDDKPAVFSAYWLKKVLRDEMGYEGMVLSDDLNMSGADSAGGYAERAWAALEAGCDMLCLCNHRKAVVDVIDSIERYRSPESDARIAQYISKLKPIPL